MSYFRQSHINISTYQLWGLQTNRPSACGLGEMNIHSYLCGYPRCVSRVTIVVFHCGFASFKEVLVKFVSFDLACTSKSVESVAVPASFKTPRMSHRATSVPSEAHVWIVGFSILMDGRSMGGVQHQWIEERLEEKGAALMASNAHAAPLHFVHPETASVFLALVDEYLGLCCTSGFNEDSCNINSCRYVQHIAPLTHFGNLSPCLRTTPLCRTVIWSAKEVLGPSWAPGEKKL